MSETIAGLEVHPVAALYPLLDEERFKGLLSSVMTDGVIHPIIVDQKDRIVDGRNRARAWEHASIIFKDSPEWAKTHELKIDRRTFSATPEGEQQEADCLSGDIEDAICQYIAAANLHRRHMAPEQKAAVILSVRQYRQRYAADCGRARAATQFKAGQIGNATGRKGKELVTLESGSPVPERDRQKSHANSTSGKIAEASGASRSVVDELAALQKTNPEAFAAVAAGEAKLKDVREKKPKKEKPKVAEPEPEDCHTAKTVHDKAAHDKAQTTLDDFIDGAFDKPQGPPVYPEQIHGSLAWNRFVDRLTEDQILAGSTKMQDWLSAQGYTWTSSGEIHWQVKLEPSTGV